MREGEDVLDYINRMFDEGWCGLCGEHRVSDDGLCELCNAEIAESMERVRVWEMEHPAEAAAQKERIRSLVNQKITAHGGTPIPNRTTQVNESNEEATP